MQLSYHAGSPSDAIRKVVHPFRRNSSSCISATWTGAASIRIDAIVITRSTISFSPMISHGASPSSQTHLNPLTSSLVKNADDMTGIAGVPTCKDHWPKNPISQMKMLTLTLSVHHPGRYPTALVDALSSQKCGHDHRSCHCRKSLGCQWKPHDFHQPKGPHSRQTYSKLLHHPQWRPPLSQHWDGRREFPNIAKKRIEVRPSVHKF